MIWILFDHMIDVCQCPVKPVFIHETNSSIVVCTDDIWSLLDKDIEITDGIRITEFGSTQPTVIIGLGHARDRFTLP